MRLRRGVKKAQAVMWFSQQWQGFRLGYMTALDDIDRTGSRPVTDESKRESMLRAERRLMGSTDEPAPDNHAVRRSAAAEKWTASDALAYLATERERLDSELEAMQIERDDWRAAALELYEALDEYAVFGFGFTPGLDNPERASRIEKARGRYVAAFARVRSLDKEGHGG